MGCSTLEQRAEIFRQRKTYQFGRMQVNEISKRNVDVIADIEQNVSGDKKWLRRVTGDK